MGRSEWMTKALLAAWGLVCLFPAASSYAGEQEPVADQATAAASRERWHEGFGLLRTGRFNEASALIRDLAPTDRDERAPRRVDEWIAAYEHLETDRQQRIREDYDKYVSWIKEEMEKGLWQQVIRSCRLAFNSAPDEETFRNEPWLGEAIAGVVKRAEEFEEQDKWYDAAGIYARLADIFPRRKEYQDALSRCQAHIRLEVVYTSQGEGENAVESEWRAVVANISPRMARDAFRRVGTDYLREPVFKDLTISALEQMLRLARAPKLAEVFEPLKDEDLVEEYCGRIEENLRQVRAQDTLTSHDLTTYFNRVLIINDETGLLPQDVLVYEFVHGALQPLDRFTDMIWPSDILEFNKHTQGRFSGVGIQIRKQYGEPIKVVTPLEDTPAYQAGIQPGDLITRINGKSAKQFTITGAVREITGPPGTSVTLTIERIGVPEPFDVTLKRQEITIFTVKGFDRDEDGQWKFMIDEEEKIGYVRLTNFTEESINELRDVIRRLRDQDGMNGLIFDLRANPGGPLKAAIDVTDLFLEGQRRIVSTRDRHGKDWEMSSTGEAGFPDFPMIVLINGISASASEIVAGALQDHGRALVVGERSYGKGSVQQVLQLNNSNQAFLKLTTALYYLPNGRCLHRDDDSETWGVDPDFEVRLVPKEMIKVNEVRLRSDILRGRDQKELSEEAIESLISPGRGDSRSPDDGDDGVEDERRNGKDEPGETDAHDEPSGEEWIEREDPNEFPAVDPQLEASLMLLRIRLATNQPWPESLTNGTGVAATPGQRRGG